MQLTKSVLVLSASAMMLASCAATMSDTQANIEATEPSSASQSPLDKQTMVDITRELSKDEYEGRAPGTAGETKTLQLLQSKFSQAGLQPGNDGSWLQEVPLVEIEAEEISPLTITGNGTSLSYDFGDDFVAVSYRAVPKTTITDSEMVFVGYGINAPERGWNDYAGVDVTGKTVVILVNDPDYETEGLEGTFGGRAMTYYGRWTYKYEEAARQGAAAAIIVHDTFPAAYGWNVVESSWSGPQFYADKGMDQTMANGWVQLPVAKEIFAAGGKDLAQMMAAAKKPGFTAVPLGLTASLNFKNRFDTKISHNVVGVLPGSERPDEYVLYSAHWDHLGRCKPSPDGDDICNGAVDNATGTAALVTLAEAFGKGGAPERSVLFLAVTAEESGLLGSKYFGENPVVPLDHIVGGINMDAFQIAGPAKNVTTVGGGKSELDAYLAAALKNVGRVATPEATPEKGMYYRSDHFSFAKQGVPMLYIKPGDDLVDGGTEAGQAVARDYTENRYHGPKDEFNPEWNWSGVMSDLELFYRIGNALANTEAWPNWVEGDEFRAVRDKSCAEGTGGC